MATLDQLRSRLNGEVAVADDAETSPWSSAVRNAAIIDGYADLWRVGVWKPVTQTIPGVADQLTYALTAIRRLDRVELLDSSSRFLELVPAVAEDDGAGAWQLRLRQPIAESQSMLVRGWTAYKSQFTSGSDTDDLPPEHTRVPLLKAKAILYRVSLASFVRYGEAQVLPPPMQASTESILAAIAAAEREYSEEAAALARLRPRSSQTRRL